ncbi:MAG: ABC transporter ATP-binding protein [Promethearchaeota archaeon]
MQGFQPNFLMALIELVGALIVLYFIVTKSNEWLPEEHQIPKEKHMKNITKSLLIISGISYGIRALFESLEFVTIFFILNNEQFHFALMISFFVLINENSTEREHRLTSSDDQITDTNSNIYKKVLIICVIIAWIIAVLFSIFKFFEFLGLLYIRKTTVAEMDVFTLGFIWTLITIAFNVVILSLINGIKSVEKRIPKEVLRNSMIFGALASFGVWSFQLIFYEIFIARILHLRLYYQDIRALIIVVTVIFLIIVWVSLKKKLLPQAIEKSKKRLNELIELEKRKLGEIHKKSEVVLDVQNLTTYFYTEEGIVRAVEGVSFKIYKGEVLGLVGETGCGKSVTALSLLKLIRPPGKIEKGKIIFGGENLAEKTNHEMLKYRGKDINMIFQDPLNSINPVYKVGEQIAEVYLIHMEKELLQVVDEYAGTIKEQQLLIEENYQQIKLIKKKKTIHSSEIKGKEMNKLNDLLTIQRDLKKKLQELKKYRSIYSVAREWSRELLGNLNIPAPEQIVDQYPHELSGGMRQRIQIAMGLACGPQLLIADEPTTALDVTVQNQILKLMKDLKKKFDTSILFITHDLGIISKMCDRVAVMYSGYIVEYGKIQKLFVKPYHPYTRGLIRSVPVVGEKKERLSTIPGMVPNLIYPPSGCRFHPRCQYRFEPCDNMIPKALEVEPNYFVACHLYDPEYSELAKKSIKKVEDKNQLKN